MGTMITMLSPDGSSGEIPIDKLDAAKQAGFKVAVTMKSPDGRNGYVPAENVHDAAAKGFKMVPMDVPEAAKASYWDALTNPVGSGGRQQGILGGALQVGGQAIKTLAQPLAHPLDTIAGAYNMLRHPQDTAEGIAQNFQNDVKQGGYSLALENAAGQLAGTVEGGRIAAPVVSAAVNAAPGAISRAAIATGDAAQDAGTGLINKTVGTLKSDFKRGANPARGYLKTGNGASLSMASIAEKSSTALDSTGEKLGAAYKQATDSGTKIPVDVVMKEIAKPLQKAIDLETGPGGTGNLTAIQSYISRFDPVFEKAAQNGGFTPSEVFDMKRSIAQNTNWSDPAQFSLKSVRQQQAGALSGILSDFVPETKGLNQTYQDLTKLTARAEERANTGSRPLTAHIYKAMMPAFGALAGGMEGNALAGAAAGALLDSVPAKTAIASGLYRGGRALSRIGERISPSEGATVEGMPHNDLGANGAKGKPGNPQLPPPDSSNSITNQKSTGAEAWAEKGAANLKEHGLSDAQIDALNKTPAGKSILMKASGIAPGTSMMRTLVRQIPPL